ncbi:hypothetical protein A1O1_07118 [Capronia coronata CBS 617.96]|uniref:Uncharacterized protein n=1 Tax=Capronia coronata CBS 617.96 TaxID=1182541 RepID=W9Y1I8_9EURO|nr:uncharacterized protein A1O1_07118 [Capronia coronata CBS 617.96]EXJ83495.1 hypothetical protein A1O1_07118 [Capronia coronata CBS 617.96]
MHLNWDNSFNQNGRVKKSTYTVPKNHEHSGHISKSQRRYKVRFQSDIRRSRRSGRFVQHEATIPSMEDDGGRSSDALPASPTTPQVHTPGDTSDKTNETSSAIESRTFSSSNSKEPHTHYQHQPQDDSGESQIASVEDATLLLFASTTERPRSFATSQGIDYSTNLDTCCAHHPTGNPHTNCIDEGSLLQLHHDEDDEAVSPSMLLAQSPESLIHHDISLQLTFQTDILPKIPRDVPLYPSQWSEARRSERRQNIQYYMEKVVPRLMPLWTAADNPFLSIVIPAATESEILMHAIMALSYYHRSLHSQDSRDGSSGEGGARSEGNDTVKALWHKQKILRMLQEKLTRPDFLTDDATLAACMLMQTFEVLFSGTSGWDHWLKGATLFIQLRGKLESDLKDSNNWVRLVKCVVAIETFAATSTCFDLLVSEQYWNIYRRLRQDDLQKMALGQLSSLNESSDDEHFEKLVGCPVVVVYSLGRMVMLIQSREETEAMERTTSSVAHTSDDEWHSTWSIESIKIEDLLFRWRPIKDAKLEKTHLAEAFRQAALVFYYRNIRRLAYCHATVQYHVQRTFDHLESIDPSSNIAGIALWPTMIAAIEIDENKNPDLTQRALKHLRGGSKNTADPLYQNAENALTILWSRRRDAKSWEAKLAVDWYDLSREMNWKWCWV